jgi:hypothetical protein
VGAARDAAAAGGALLVVYAGWSVLAAFVVPRRVRTALSHGVSRAVAAGFHQIAGRAATYERRDAILAVEGPAMLLGQLASWLAVLEVGFGLLLWPFTPRGGLVRALEVAASSLTTLGYEAPVTGAAKALADVAGLAGLGTVALLIGYLPTLYAAFNRRESLVTLLDSRAGVPSWGPELLARTHYGLGTGVSAVEELPALFERWEQWSADVSETHSTYVMLTRFRSPRPLSSWLTAQLAVLDAAALYLSLLGDPPSPLAARLCLRSGFTCLTTVARALGARTPEDPDPDRGVELTYAEFVDVVERLRQVGFPVERPVEDAWSDFVGWRVNYEEAAYYIAAAVDAPPALWSGPRRRPLPPIPPVRPLLRKRHEGATPKRPGDAEAG